MPTTTVYTLCYAKEKGKKLYAGFMDYEKAFDLDLMKKGCVKFITRAITNMFHKSPYYPKTGNN